MVNGLQGPALHVVHVHHVVLWVLLLLLHGVTTMLPGVIVLLRGVLNVMHGVVNLALSNIITPCSICCVGWLLCMLCR